MKVLVSLAALLFVCASVKAAEISSKDLEEIIRANAKVHSDKCAKEVGIETELATRISFGDLTIRDEKAQCFLECFFKSSGFFNDKSEPLQDIFLARLAVKDGVKNAKLEEVVNKCIQEKGENKCETAFKISECYWINSRLITV